MTFPTMIFLLHPFYDCPGPTLPMMFTMHLMISPPDSMTSPLPLPMTSLLPLLNINGLEVFREGWGLTNLSLLSDRMGPISSRSSIGKHNFMS